VSWRGLRYKGTERLTSREWNVIVDALNDLYGFLTSGLQDIYVDEVYGRAGYFSEQVLVQGKPVIKDGDPISIYQFYDIAKQQITEAIDRSSQLSKVVSSLDQIYGKLPSREDITSAVDSAKVTSYSLDIREYARRTTETVETYAPKLATIEEYTRETRDVLVKVKIDEYGNVGVKIAEPLLSAVLNNIDVALSSRASESTLLAIKSKTENLDIALSALRDALKPARSPVTQDLSGYLLEAEASVNIDKPGLDGWSALVVTVRAKYGTSPSFGIRVRWLYSPDGVNYDSPEEADAQRNYYDFTVEPEATRQATILVPILTPYVRIQIVNMDPVEGVYLSVWTLTVR
jgi:hypothetical protein